VTDMPTFHESRQRNDISSCVSGYFAAKLAVISSCPSCLHEIQHITSIVCSSRATVQLFWAHCHFSSKHAQRQHIRETADVKSEPVSLSDSVVNETLDLAVIWLENENDFDNFNSFGN